ncbi:DUF418 domain-containing protein [Quadrisphaera sp. DSM 44207]|uniref:DUF418 domain-containing protein n=1 Tax=Quadrisphaera sp. DSM 44207 TaxID=1881057 RepID=UPI0008832E79|nr:DUF418 domain-containing protein [Quadrisphaera sp. DSM 44207]SDQ70293.1 Uncharacterized membrane protein YeiB [Quadrisphaera sp. DSM 44207]
MSTLRAAGGAAAADPGPPAHPATDPADPGGRLVVLDVLRGVALCGIVWLNVPGLTGFTRGAQGFRDLAPWLEPLARGRFIGLFALLFGVSAALVLRGAARRGARPRAVLARRMAFLLGLGLLHGLLYPAEVLRSYALYGLVLLLPLSFVRPPWVPLALGAAALAAVELAGGEPGGASLAMVLLGYGAARLGLPERLERPARGAVLVAALLLPAYAGLLVAQRVVQSPIVDGVQAAYTWADRAAGVVGAGTTGLLVALALRTRLRRALRAVFEPLGRTALSSYVGATLLAVLARAVSGSATTATTGPDLLVAAGIIALQVPASRWWLARFRHGPLEWAWRCATWWRVVPLRRGAAPRRAGGELPGRRDDAPSRDRVGT